MKLGRLFTLVLLLVFVVACGSSGGSGTTPPLPKNPTGLSPDVIEVSSFAVSPRNSYIQMDVIVKNNASVKIDEIIVTVKLLKGNTVIDDGIGYYLSGLNPGQQASDDITFNDTESADEFDCYEYNVEIVTSSAVADKDYPGTCN